MEKEKYLMARNLVESLERTQNDLAELRAVVVGGDGMCHITLAQSGRFYQCDISAQSAQSLVDWLRGTVEKKQNALEKALAEL